MKMIQYGTFKTSTTITSKSSTRSLSLAEEIIYLAKLTRDVVNPALQSIYAICGLRMKNKTFHKKNINSSDYTTVLGFRS